MEKAKPPLTIIEVLQAKAKIRVQKTRKNYYHTKNYAKHITRAHIGEQKEKAIHEYFLPVGCIWQKVTKEEYETATSKEVLKKLHEELERELRERVEREMAELGEKPSS